MPSSYPTLTVKIAFGNNPNDASLTFTDITAYVRTVKSMRGRQRLMRSQAQFQAGTLAVQLDNRDRRFDPTDTAGPYYPDVQPEKIVQLGATWSSVYYPIWTGFVDDWPQSWPGFSEGMVALGATDYFKSLAILRVLSSGYPQAVLASSPEGYYRLGEVSGTVETLTADSSGTNRPAFIFGTPSFGASGCLVEDPNTAMGCNSSAGIQLPYGNANVPPFASATDPSYLTTMWFQVSTLPVTDTIIMVVGQHACYINPTGTLALEYVTTFTTTAGYNDGAFHRVDLYNHSTGSGNRSAEWFVDGKLVYTDADSSSGEWLASNLPSGRPYGCAWGSAGVWLGLLPFDGVIDEIAVYSGATADAMVSSGIATQFPLATFPAQYTGQRVAQFLNTIGQPTGNRRVDTGRTFCGIEETNQNQTKALTYLQYCEQTEQGQLFIGPDGFVVFQDRYHRYENPNATSLYTFGDGGSAFPTELPYVIGGVSISFDRTELYNEIPVSREGSSNTEVAQNLTSIAEYNNRTLIGGLSNLLMATDSDALYCGEWIVADTAYPQLYVGDLVLDPNTNPALWPAVLGLDVSDVVTVNKHNIPGGGAAISLTCRVEGIEHQIDPPHTWKTTLHLSVQGTLPWFILNDPVMGILDSGDRWGW